MVRSIHRMFINWICIGKSQYWQGRDHILITRLRIEKFRSHQITSEQRKCGVCLVWTEQNLTEPFLWKQIELNREARQVELGLKQVQLGSAVVGGVWYRKFTSITTVIDYNSIAFVKSSTCGVEICHFHHNLTNQRSLSLLSCLE